MSFSEALEIIKEGGLVRRSGWNGKGMHVYLENMFRKITNHPSSKNDGHRVYEPVVVLLNARGNHQAGWVCSQEDMLANDWEVA